MAEEADARREAQLEAIREKTFARYRAAGGEAREADLVAKARADAEKVAREQAERERMLDEDLRRRKVLNSGGHVPEHYDVGSRTRPRLNDTDMANQPHDCAFSLPPSAKPRSGRSCSCGPWRHSLHSMQTSCNRSRRRRNSMGRG